MASRVVEIVSAAGRRGFIAQLSAGSAAIVSGLFGIGSRAVEAHEERLTMAPALLSLDWGITTYRVRHSGRGTGAERIAAQLLDATGRRLGEFARTRTYRRKAQPYTKIEAGVVKQYTMNKQLLHKEDIQLAWGNEILEVETDSFRGSFGVKYNGRHCGWATVTRESQEASPEILDILANRSELLSVAGAIGEDLNRAFPRPPRESETCCCDIACSGSNVTSNGWGFTSTSACASAVESCHTSCWNSYCTGCCEITSANNCSCACLQGSFISTQFLCVCIGYGTACACASHCYQ